MTDRKYQLLGLEVAIQLLRPGATWEFFNDHFSKWDDPRPCPTMKEIQETLEKVKAFEESIPTIWLPDQKEES